MCLAFGTLSTFRGVYAAASAAERTPGRRGGTGIMPVRFDRRPAVDTEREPARMLARLRPLATRLAAWWRPWRLALLAASVALLVVAVLVDQAWLAALAAVTALLPISLLVSMLGSRLANHHADLVTLNKSSATTKADGRFGL